MKMNAPMLHVVETKQSQLQGGLIGSLLTELNFSSYGKEEAVIYTEAFSMLKTWSCYT